ncbi:hypothetical protein [Rhodococcus sp. C3V]|uniref:hypothetical protein n=1 Tax=Rhodococcus sp. C3V TaxID=3034165 RepID=UPI0023E10ACB|nr:hypothetical protein [Rhodococcus sp. C3V]MDF3320135.1 hypothetical protein [Rhodococcus sp. C3V]
MTASTGVGYSVLLLLLLAGSLALLAFFKRKALIRWPSIAVATIFVVVAVYVGLINDPSDSDEPTAFSATTSERPTTTTTTPPPMTTPTSTLPTPAGPPLPPEEQVINESKSAEFFDGALLLANQSTYSSYVALTITTDATSCTSYLDVGERAVIAANDAGNRFFRVTVLETDPDASARLRVEDLPQENWPARSLFCPT